MAALAGKRCLITGASGGLGRALALELGGRGCRLILTGRSQRNLDDFRAHLGGTPGVEATIEADLTRQLDLDGLVDAVHNLVGGVDILVNNAGVFPIGPLASLEADRLDECLVVNLRVPAMLCRAFAPGMAEREWGRIVNIASSSAYAGFANSAVYCASKHGLLGLSRALDDELRPRGVRVISVSPGSIKTSMGRLVPGQTYDNFMEPSEVAAITAHVVGLDGNMIVNELRLGRMVMG